ncbi:MAG: hypothetical protein OEW87_04585, partial [Flavobacteriaceae bacterium]|nr:hypothetical protein [Flavobacteriaceae bacterium]
DFQQVNIPVGGIYVIPFDGYSGDIVWDKSQISAVIIDGQHRYKALIESTEKNKNYLECRVVVNLVDLIPICSRDNRGPTDIARDLFVTINNTPVEVDESRLILMDDKDVLSTFTQVLVDDSDAEAKPAIQPELIDWKCDGAKHDSDVSVSGIIPLRQVVQSSMFSNLSISSIDDRQNKKKVRTWLDWLNSWLNQDEEIKAQLGIQETLERRYEVANLDDEEDEGEEGLFLFSYSSKATQIIKEKFKILYLPVFRLSYSELLPYKECTELAVAEGVFDKSTNIHKYLRAFTGTRKILEKDAVIKSEIDSFKKKFKEITYNSIPHTVMGQKAIFKTLFEYYISTVDEYDEKKILKIALSFVKNFNDVYEKLSPTKNIDENLLNIKYKMDKAVDVNKAGDLGRDIWRGIILKQNGEIDYSSNSVSILSAVFADILEFYISDEGNNFKFSGGVRKKILNKHKRIIKNIDSEIDEGEALKISENIIKGKEKKFHQVLSG